MVVIERGQIWWANLPESRGSEPAFTRPLSFIQADSFNRSRIQTVLAITITSNLRLADAPDIVSLNSNATRLPKDSVANVSQVITIGRNFLVEPVGRVVEQYLAQISRGLRLVLDL